MSQLSKIFQKAPVEVFKYSGFDMSHINVGTMKVGTLTPVLAELIYPGDKVSVGINANFQLPPMATDFVGKVDVRFEAFFVPLRLCWQGWQKFYNNLNVDQYTSPVTRLPKARLQFDSGAEVTPVDIFGAGTLADYLGYQFNDSILQSQFGSFEIKNVTPFIAYGLIYDRWYRDKLIQRPLFATPDEIDNMVNSESSPFSGNVANQFSAAMMPYRFGPDGVNSEYMNELLGEEFLLTDNFLYADGSHLFQLRQRNWAKDYFTVGTPLPQAGESQRLRFTVVDGTGTFSIAALREVNSLQRFSEDRNLAGSEYDSIIMAEWGVRPADAVLQHPMLLGSSVINVYNRSVMQTANGNATNPDGSRYDRNPFAETAGASFGKSQALGTDSIIDNFEAKEHGIVMILASLVPHAFYATGTRKYLNYNEFADFPNPKLVAVGDQPIMLSELANVVYPGYSEDREWAYTQRYAEKKFHNDEVHGLMRDGKSLEHFTIQRSFESLDGTAGAQINSDFLEIKQDAMDNVTAVASTLSEFGAWYEIAFQEKIVSAFPEYSIPTLGHPDGTKTIMIDKGGKRL